MLDYRMNTFLTLCEKMNYTKTAEALHITQPAVTQQMRWLEEQYGCRLFLYQGKVLRLTEKGKVLHRLAQQMAANERSIREEMARTETEEIHLRIGATKTIGDYIIPPIMVGFLKEHPQYRLQMSVDNTERLLKRMENGELDFVMAEGFFDKERYDFTLYQKERFLGICGGECSLLGKQTTLWDTRKESLILRENGSGTRDILEELLKEHNFTVHSFAAVQEISNFNAIKELVAASLGITFLYEPVVRKELQEGKLFALDISDFQIYREFNYVYMQNRLFPDACRAFIAYAAAYKNGVFEKRERTEMKNREHGLFE